MNPRAHSVCPLGWSTNQDGNVVLTMTRDDYDRLLLSLGAGASAMNANGSVPLSRSLALVNRLNAGNPNFRPYQIPEESSAT